MGNANFLLMVNIFAHKCLSDSGSTRHFEGENFYFSNLFCSVRYFRIIHYIGITNRKDFGIFINLFIVFRIKYIFNKSRF